jgi:hypothetical protein
MTITSPAFDNGEPISTKYTCQEEDISPPLVWSGAPENTVSFVLISDDPGTGGIQGRNGWRRNDYGGPCPPSGIHRYFFRLYALDTRLELAPSANKRKVVRAMKDHIIAEAELMGTYSKK